MDEIELRSENIRRIIGPIPHRLFVTGVLVISLLGVALLLALFCIPNPNDGHEKLFDLLISSLIVWN